MLILHAVIVDVRGAIYYSKEVPMPGKGILSRVAKSRMGNFYLWKYFLEFARYSDKKYDILSSNC